MAKSQIFRQSALDRLSSPEQLDTLLAVTTPKGWLALFALAALLVGAGVWAAIGRIPTRVGGMGILVKRSGLAAINSIAAGQVAEILVHAGDVVSRDQPVVRLSLPDLAAELTNAKANLAALESQDRQLGSLGNEDVRLQISAVAEQRQVALTAIEVAKERQASLQVKLQSQQKLLADGLITEQVVQATRDNLNLARADVARAQAQLKELTVRESESRQRNNKEGGERKKRLEEARRTIGLLEDKIKLHSIVKSPEAGRVIELRTATGGIVTPGTPLVMLERIGPEGGLDAIVYVPATEGKKIRRGMKVEVSPSTVKREEYGAMRALVTEVSEFPSTQQAMLANLGNQELVTSFFRQIDTPIELRVEVTPDRATASGFAWTSPKGPPQNVQPGTMCNVSLTVREQAPISLVVPMLRETLGL